MACIFDIKRYALHDGPGIRTTIFVKGCPLRCVWCHNPESWTSVPQRLYKQNKCIGCRICTKTCPQGILILTPEGITSNADNCVLCGSCADACPALALELCGKEWDMEELMAEIEKERGVMENGGGGVTISGGEPLMHPDFTLELLKALGAKGFHRAVDTTLFAQEIVVKKIAEECELLLVDLKSMDSEIHKFYTGVPNELILSNLKLVGEMDHPYRIRIPLISEVNASDENIEKSALFLSSLKRKPELVELLPYHDIGKGKHERMGTSYNPEGYKLSAPSQKEIEHCISIMKNAGLNVVSAS